MYSSTPHDYVNVKAYVNVLCFSISPPGAHCSVCLFANICVMFNGQAKVRKSEDEVGLGMRKELE